MDVDRGLTTLLAIIILLVSVMFILCPLTSGGILHHVPFSGRGGRGAI